MAKARKREANKRRRRCDIEVTRCRVGLLVYTVDFVRSGRRRVRLAKR